MVWRCEMQNVNSREDSEKKTRSSRDGLWDVMSFQSTCSCEENLTHW